MIRPTLASLLAVRPAGLRPTTAVLACTLGVVGAGVAHADEAAAAPAAENAPAEHAAVAEHVEATASDAAALEEHGEHGPREEAPAHEFAENGVSGRVLAGAEGLENGSAGMIFGGGVAYEHDFADGALAIEVASEGIVTPEGTAVLAEFLVEKPIELAEGFGVYFGAGPSATVHLGEGETKFAAGGLGLLGIEANVVDNVKVFAEFDSAVFLIDAVPEFEADVGTGVMFRF
jgi:hypothetical protein